MPAFLENILQSVHRVTAGYRGYVQAVSDYNAALVAKWEASYIDQKEGFEDITRLVTTVSAEIKAGQNRTALTIDPGDILVVERRSLREDVSYAVCFSPKLILLYRQGYFTEEEMKAGVKHELQHKKLGHLGNASLSAIEREDQADAHVRNRQA